MKRRDAARRFIDSAQSAIDRGDVDEGLATLRRAVDANPQDADLRIAQAAAQLAAEDYPVVIATATVAIGLSPADHRGYYLRARAQERRGKIAEAVADVHRAVELAPDDFASHVLLGRLELAQRNFFRAADAAEHAIALDRRSPEGHSLLADVAFETQQWDILEVAARAVLRLRSNDRRAKELLNLAKGRVGPVVDPGAVPVSAADPTVNLEINQRLTASREASGTRPRAGEPTGSPPARMPRVKVGVVGRVIAGVLVIAALALGVVVSPWLAALALLPVIALFTIRHASRDAPREAPRDRVRELLARGMDDVDLGSEARSGENAESAAMRAAPHMRRVSPAKREAATPAPDDAGLTVERADDGLAVRYSQAATDIDADHMGVDELLAAAEKAIEAEQWSTAEGHLRHLLEIEPLYLNAHDKLMFVLQQQQPWWSPRR